MKRIKQSLTVFMTAMVFSVSDFIIPINPAVAEIQIAAETQSQDFNKVIGAVVVIEIKRTINDTISNFAIGSGAIISEDGYILTNYHVIEGNEDNLAIHYLPKTEHISRYIGDPNAMRLRPRADVKIINSYPKRDIALLKIEGSGFPTIKLGDDPKIGDEVFAIGNPLSLNWTVTKGIISKEISIPRNFREFDYFIQTDTAINPGNSGGPLLNVKGELVGLNSGMVGVAGYPINIGLNLAVPIGDIKILLPRLMKEKTRLKLSYLGIGFIPPYQEAPELEDNDANYISIPQERDGVLIVDVKSGSPAEQAGLLVGDIIQSIEGRKIISFFDYNQAVVLQKPGKLVSVEIRRQDKIKTLFIKLGEKPEDAI